MNQSKIDTAVALVIILAIVAIATMIGVGRTHDDYLQECFNSGGRVAEWQQDHWECKR